LFLLLAINANYVMSMIDFHKFIDPYFFIGDDFAIPHALPYAGVYRLAMCLLVVIIGVYFSDTELVLFVIVFAPVDFEHH
ncbi:PTS sugar transporter subunit IIA, partial [Listeria monocytogenes]